MRQYIHYRWSLFLLIIGFFMGLLFTQVMGSGFSGIPIDPSKVSDGPEYSHRTPEVTDLVKIFPKEVYRQGDPKTPAIALTFDDGPDDKYTPIILDTLKKYDIKATFFVVGTQIMKHPEMFRRIVREGHEIGSHSFQHVKLSELPAAKIRYQLAKNNEIIARYGGPKTVTYFRPPYGALDPAAVQTILEFGDKIALWTVDSLDWRSLKRPEVIDNIVPITHPGDIILQHCAADSKRENLFGSVDALPDIIQDAKAKGYRFLTISQLLAEDQP